MKKKQKKIASGAALESEIHSHAEFFDHLVQLIPSRFYLQNDDADSKPWFQGLSKAAKASLKLQSKRNIKLSRRQRFDPDHETTKTPLADEENLAGNRVDDSAKDESKEKSVTYEELRQRLRRKIEMLRGNRGEGRVEGKKRRRSDENDGGESRNDEHEEEDEEEEEIIEYGKVRVGDDDEDDKSGKKKKRKLSKVHELERAKKLQEVKKEKPSVAERESWKAATSRAMGYKVHDDVRLIKESMKRDKKKKVKNAEKWKDRVQTQEKMKGDRQKKRKDNIVGRINDKKMRKIAKREKKLMRPGFEGRKEGFITPA
ncbi:hypothetical protein ACJIZ3_021630 [Penstemon smallii]|uniref:Ribosomal RNA-processing protein 14/surfeit locus protein 6 C-terminal domain-containing protein n=1 Tax=Penstemon smallii TaxID=265156 RepID=A0ABD3SMI2_9LAMI